jgi:hypothetical protein
VALLGIRPKHASKESPYVPEATSVLAAEEVDPYPLELDPEFPLSICISAHPNMSKAAAEIPKKQLNRECVFFMNFPSLCVTSGQYNEA